MQYFDNDPVASVMFAIIVAVLIIACLWMAVCDFRKFLLSREEQQMKSDIDARASRVSGIIMSGMSQDEEMRFCCEQDAFSTLDAWIHALDPSLEDDMDDKYRVQWKLMMRSQVRTFVEHSHRL